MDDVHSRQEPEESASIMERPPQELAVRLLDGKASPRVAGRRLGARTKGGSPGRGAPVPCKM
jgi:hypothetical protein